MDGLIWSAHGACEVAADVLRVAPGEVGVVIAEPLIGEGLADVLTGLAPPAHGTIRLDGEPVTGAPGTARSPWCRPAAVCCRT